VKRIKLPTVKIRFCQAQDRHNLRGFSIVTLPDFYAKIRWKPNSISAEIFNMCDSERVEVKIADTGKSQREI
jgi:hypothetical protein